MNIVELVAILKSGRRQEIDETLSHLEYVFSSYVKKIDDFQIILNTLLECYLNESDLEMKLGFLNTLAYAACCRDFGSFSYDIIVKELLNNENVKIIANCLIILGFTRDITYLPIIDKFKTHKDGFVVGEAYDAIREIVACYKLDNDTDVVPGYDYNDLADKIEFNTDFLPDKSKLT